MKKADKKELENFENAKFLIKTKELSQNLSNNIYLFGIFKKKSIDFLFKKDEDYQSAKKIVKKYEIHKEIKKIFEEQLVKKEVNRNE